MASLRVISASLAPTDAMLSRAGARVKISEPCFCLLFDSLSRSRPRCYLPSRMNNASTQPPSPLRPGLRAQWLLDDRTTFLNHGSFGAMPRCVFDEQNRWRQRIEAEPVELLGRGAPELIAAAKQPIGQWLGMRNEDFGFVTNATEGINAVLHSLELHAGDELLTTTHVYNAVRQSMRHIANLAASSYREIDLPLSVLSPAEITRVIVNALSARTRLVVIDHVTSPTSLIFPVEQIVAACAQRGVDVLIDGAHAPGMLPLNVAQIGAAYYAGNLHKWTCGPKGSGFLWARPDRQARVHPVAVSHLFGQGFAREFSWQGARGLSTWLAVPRALEFMAELGWERVRSPNHAKANWVQQMLC